MKVLVDDVEELKAFLNESYHANEFYIRDIVGAAMYVIDELSIRSHIESLPAIVNEIWEVMGESGEAIRKSILWIVQTVSWAVEIVHTGTNDAMLYCTSVRFIAHFTVPFTLAFEVAFALAPTPLFFHMLTRFSGQRVVQKSGGIHKRSR